MNSQAELGFLYYVDVVAPDGTVSQGEWVHNLIPIEGLNHMMGVTFKSVTPVATWYIGLYEGNYTPVPGVTAATISSVSTECVAYTPAQRVTFVSGSVVNGALDNSASKAEFTFTADKTVYGGFIVSASPRNATTGTIISAVRFSSPKVLENGSVLRVTAGNSLVSA